MAPPTNPLPQAITLPLVFTAANAPLVEQMWSTSAESCSHTQLLSPPSNPQVTKLPLLFIAAKAVCVEYTCCTSAASCSRTSSLLPPQYFEPHVVTLPVLLTAANAW